MTPSMIQGTLVTKVLGGGVHEDCFRYSRVDTNEQSSFCSSAHRKLQLSSPTELNANIVCPQFSGGGLTSVQISVSGGITGSITLTNNASTTQTVTGTTSSAFSIGALAGFTIVNPIFSASYTTGPQSLTAGQSKTFAGLSGTGSDNLGTDTTVLAPYTGAGTFNIAVSTLTGLTV